jgi:hypothetical protein
MESPFGRPTRHAFRENPQRRSHEEMGRDRKLSAMKKRPSALKSILLSSDRLESTLLLTLQFHLEWMMLGALRSAMRKRRPTTIAFIPRPRRQSEAFRDCLPASVTSTDVYFQKASGRGTTCPRSAVFRYPQEHDRLIRSRHVHFPPRRQGTTAWCSRLSTSSGPCSECQ